MISELVVYLPMTTRHLMCRHLYAWWWPKFASSICSKSALGRLKPHGLFHVTIKSGLQCCRWPCFIWYFYQVGLIAPHVRKLNYRSWLRCHYLIVNWNNFISKVIQRFAIPLLLWFKYNRITIPMMTMATIITVQNNENRQILFTSCM